MTNPRGLPIVDLAQMSNTDATDGHVWHCQGSVTMPDGKREPCNFTTLRGERAVAHATDMAHGVPRLVAIDEVVQAPSRATSSRVNITNAADFVAIRDELSRAAMDWVLADRLADLKADALETAQAAAGDSKDLGALRRVTAALAEYDAAGAHEQAADDRMRACARRLVAEIERRELPQPTVVLDEGAIDGKG